MAVNVVRPEATGEERERLMADLTEATTPYDAAGVLGLDEVIDPASTRQVLADDLGHGAEDVWKYSVTTSMPKLVPPSVASFHSKVTTSRAAEAIRRGRSSSMSAAARVSNTTSRPTIVAEWPQGSAVASVDFSKRRELFFPMGPWL